jgi:hypothetical protein
MEDATGEKFLNSWTDPFSSGKPNVRFDEGELEIEPRLLRQFPTLPIPALSL